MKPIAKLLLSLSVLAVVGGGSPSVTEAAGANSYTAIGDSITEGYGVSRSYPTRLTGMLGQTVFNEGIGGQFVSQGKARLQQVINSRHPTHLVILFGTNDVNAGLDLNSSSQQLQSMAEVARGNGVVPIVGTIPPMIGAAAQNNGRVNQLNNYIRSRVSDESYVMADVGAAFGGGGGLIQNDGFHPNDSGQQVIADALLPYLQLLPQIPAAPVVAAPVGQVTSGRRPTFSWSGSEQDFYSVGLLINDVDYVQQDNIAGTSWVPPIDLPCGSLAWWVRARNASGYGPWSAIASFTFRDADCCIPDKLTNLAAEVGVDGSVTYSCDHDACAHNYQLHIEKNNIAWYDQVSPFENPGSRIEWTVPNHTLGSYKYWFRASSDDGIGVWSDAAAFARGQVVALTPSGEQTERPRVFVWDEGTTNGAQWYQLWLERSGLPALSQWYRRDDTLDLGDGRRSLTLPDDIEPIHGDYVWSIKTWELNGSGPWAEPQTFSIPVQLPTVPVPLSPVAQESVAASVPQFSWQAAEGATRYQLLIEQGSASVDAWFEGETSGPSPIALAAGAYTWRVRGENIDGLGPWSDAVPFFVWVPGPAELLTPRNSTGGERRPEFTWNEVAEASNYQILVQRNGQTVINRWVGAETSFTPGSDLADGAYSWSILTANAYGLGAWSEALDFQIP